MAGKDSSVTVNDDNKCIKNDAFLHKNILSEDGKIKFIFITSLENIAKIKVVSSLWTTQSILQKVLNCGSTRESSLRWKSLVNYVASKIFGLPIAKSVAEKLVEAVPIIGSQLLNWIRYLDACNLKSSKNFAVQLANSIQWTARGKINYPQTVKSILANPNCSLSADQKYKLACTCCLEDEIALIAPEVLNPAYLNFVSIELYPMVHYWTAKITNDARYSPFFNNFSQSDKDSRISQFIMELLTDEALYPCTQFNDVPIMYIWNKFSEEEKAKNIVLVLTRLCSLDLKFSVLLNFNYEKQQEILKECYENILQSILHDQFFGQNFLPVSFHIFHIIKSEIYNRIFEPILAKMSGRLIGRESKHMYDHYKSIFKHLWQEGSKHSKDFIFDHRHRFTLERYVTFMLSWNRDMDVIKLIFHDLYAQGKKYMPLGAYSIQYCSYLLLSNQWELLELFIKYALFYEKYVSQLNQKHLKKREPEIEYFFEALNKKMYCSKRYSEDEEWWKMEEMGVQMEVIQFRQSSSYLKCQTIFESVIIETEVNLKDLENHFGWCFDELPKSYKWFQKYFPEVYCWILVICKLVEEDRYELLYHKIKMFKC